MRVNQTRASHRTYRPMRHRDEQTVQIASGYVTLRDITRYDTLDVMH